MTETQRIS